MTKKIKEDEMKFKIQSMLVFVVLTISGVNSYADVSVRPRAGLAYTDYNLEFTSGSGSISDSNYLTLDLGLTIVNESIYYDVAFSNSINATHDFTTTGQDEDFSRSDFVLAVGYLLKDHWSVFAGYKFGDTEYSNYADGVSIDTKLKFKTEGFFVGGSKVIPVKKHALSLNAAVAFLNADLTDTDELAVPLDASADSIGISLGVAYSIPLKNNMGLVAKISYQNYDFSDFSDPVYSVDDITENILNIGGVFYVNF